MRYCEKCNKNVSEDFKHCPDCGNKLSRIVKEEPEQKDSRKAIEFDLFAKKTIFSIIIVVAAIIALGFVIANPTGFIPLVNPNGTTTTTTVAPTTTTTISKFSISVKAINEYTNEPIEGAIVYLDGSDVGVTGQYGTKTIQDVLKGSHNLEVVYKGKSSKIPIDVSSVSNFEIKIKAPIDVMITLKDQNTNYAVNAVRVYLDGKEYGNTLNDGSLELKDVMPGNYKFSIDITNYGMLDVGYRNIESSTTEIKVNMPHPDFSPNSLSCIDDYDTWKLSEYGICTVSLKNMGDIASDSTSVVLLVYLIENNTISSKPIASRLLDFGNMATDGYPITKNTDRMYEFKWGKQEDAVAIIFDKWKYTPENKKEIQGVSIPDSITNEWIIEAKQFCSDDPERCAKVAGIFVGTAIKTATGGG